MGECMQAIMLLWCELPRCAHSASTNCTLHWDWIQLKLCTAFHWNLTAVASGLPRTLNLSLSGGFHAAQCQEVSRKCWSELFSLQLPVQCNVMHCCTGHPRIPTMGGPHHTASSSALYFCDFAFFAPTNLLGGCHHHCSSSDHLLCQRFFKHPFQKDVL